MATMRRAALVVLYGEVNYGNHLVNLAGRWVLERCGLSVDLIAFVGGRAELRRAGLARLPAKLKRLVFSGELVARLRERLHAARLPRLRHQDREASRILDLRRDRFRSFSTQYLRPRFVAVSQRFDVSGCYDCFVVGGDQIWNYDYGLGGWQFLDFAVTGERLALAPSVGHDRIPAEWASDYVGWLAPFAHLGVRESEWLASLPDPAPGRAATTLVDPTLLFDAELWSTVARSPQESQPYLLAYELGEFSDQRRRLIAATARASGLRVVWLSQRRSTAAWATGPAEFLGLVRDAALVVTDSFHGSVFSFLFDRPLAIVRRDGSGARMNGRIGALVSGLALADRIWDEQSLESLLAHDYAQGRARLDARREEFWDYLARFGLHEVPLAGGLPQ